MWTVEIGGNLLVAVLVGVFCALVERWWNYRSGRR
jgi:hypothetical protein